MRKPLAAAFCALAIAGAGAAPASAADAAPTGVGKAADTGAVTSAVSDVVTSAGQALSGLDRNPKAKAVNFAGTVALSNCSGSVVRMPDSEDNDPALVMTNGHCLETGFPGPGEVRRRPGLQPHLQPAQRLRHRASPPCAPPSSPTAR